MDLFNMKMKKFEIFKNSGVVTIIGEELIDDKTSYFSL
jgi:hypothetical protein